MRLRFYSRHLTTWCRHLYFLRQNLHVRATQCRVTAAAYQAPNRLTVTQKHQRGFANNGGFDGNRVTQEVDEFRIDADDVNDRYDDDDDDGNDRFYEEDEDHHYDDDDEFDHTSMDRDVGRLSGEQIQKMSMKPNSPRGSKILRVSIIGAPNSGKSTLINSLMGWKLNGVSSKVHTTEKNTLSMFSHGNTQIVFTDTPGVMTPAERIKHNNSIETMEAPGKSVQEADIIGVIVDCGLRYERKFRETVLQILHDHADKPSFLILNKIDLLKEDSVVLTVSRKLTNGIIGGAEFGQHSGKKIVRDPDRVLLTEEGFDKMYKHLEKNYGKIDVGTTVEITDSKILDFDKSKEEVEETNAKKEDKVVKTDPPFKLEEDSFQKEFIEEILNRNKNSAAGENWENTDTSSDTSGENHFESVTETKRWTSSMEEHRHKSLKPYWENFDAVFPISALTGAGIGYLMEFLHKTAKPGPWLYHSSVVTNQDPAQIAKMCVRQALLDHLGGALPYLIDPDIVYWNVTDDNRLDIVMEIVVRNNYEKGLLLGRGQRPAFAAGLEGNEKKRLLKIIERNEQFSSPVSVVTKVSWDAKQALLDVFRCEMKFKLTVRQDGSIKRSKKSKSRHGQKLTKRHVSSFNVLPNKDTF